MRRPKHAGCYRPETPSSSSKAARVARRKVKTIKRTLDEDGFKRSATHLSSIRRIDSEVIVNIKEGCVYVGKNKESREVIELIERDQVMDGRPCVKYRGKRYGNVSENVILLSSFKLWIRSSSAA